MDDQIILVGCGNMGFAMLKSWIDAHILNLKNVYVVEPISALRERVSQLGVQAVTHAEKLKPHLDPRMVLFAVKPQIITQIIPAYAQFEKAIFVSIAAGISIALLEEHLSKEIKIIRCMPNMPAAIGKGMLVTCANANVTGQDRVFIETLLKTNGRVVSISDEDLMDLVTAVSGSGPAYVFHFIECLTEAGIASGLPCDIANLLAIQTIYGAAALAASSHDSPSKLREQVTSPNGTTAAALTVLMKEDRLKNLIEETVQAARKRAGELSNQKRL